MRWGGSLKHAAVVAFGLNFLSPTAGTCMLIGDEESDPTASSNVIVFNPIKDELKAFADKTGNPLGTSADSACVTHGLLKETIDKRFDSRKIVLLFIGPRERAQHIERIVTSSAFRDDVDLVVLEDNKVFREQVQENGKGYIEGVNGYILVFKDGADCPETMLPPSSEALAEMLRGYLKERADKAAEPPSYDHK